MNQSTGKDKPERRQSELERAVNRLHNALGYDDLSSIATTADIEAIIRLTDLARPYIERVFGPVDLDEEP